nr:MAG TPA: hypothetical protein [Caudoviricetes sp.]
MSARLCEGSCELVPTELKNLKINRVDLVPEGANSAAFVTLFKGKELKLVDFEELMHKMKPEYATVINEHVSALSKAKDESDAALSTANATIVSLQADLEKAKQDKEAAEAAADEAKKAAEGTVPFDEDEQLAKSIEGLDPQVREYFERITKQKDAAEEIAKAALAKEKRAEAEAKAEELKALPVEKAKLVDFIEKSNDTAGIEMLSAIAKGIEATVLTEVGKSNATNTFTASAEDAWGKIEASAKDIAKSRNISKEAAVAAVISEQPDLYREYLKGGAN